MTDLSVVNDLKIKGFRITKVRKTMLSLLHNIKNPQSVAEIGQLLLRKDISVNKTTIYRELEFLIKQDIIREVEFGDGKKRYELNIGEHHHHIVCVKCGKVEDIDFDLDMSKHEKEISNKTNFKIIEHSIEFFGLCPACSA